jgi:hypothetical protein
VQDFFLNWKPHYCRTQVINVTPNPRPLLPNGRVGLFFSAGVDAFFTLMKHQDEITDLIFIRGFDIPLTEVALLDRVSEAIHRAAAGFNKHVIEIETNAASFSTYFLPGHQVYGSLLTSAGHLLYPQFSRIYISAAHTPETLAPNGSHPDLDPFWSSTGLTFIHDGLETRRIDKVASVVQSDIVLENLRVCLENRGSQYNCGRCQKCLRTMVALRMAGALERCKTFDRPLDLKRVARLRPQRQSRRVYFEEILQELEHTKADPDLEQAVRSALQEPGLIKRVLGRIEKLRFRGERRRRFQK